MGARENTHRRNLRNAGTYCDRAPHRCPGGRIPRRFVGHRARRGFLRPQPTPGEPACPERDRHAAGASRPCRGGTGWFGDPPHQGGNDAGRLPGARVSPRPGTVLPDGPAAPPARGRIGGPGGGGSGAAGSGGAPSSDADAYRTGRRGTAGRSAPDPRGVPGRGGCRARRTVGAAVRIPAPRAGTGRLAAERLAADGRSHVFRPERRDGGPRGEDRGARDGAAGGARGVSEPAGHRPGRPAGRRSVSGPADSGARGLRRDRPEPFPPARRTSRDFGKQLLGGGAAADRRRRCVDGERHASAPGSTEHLVPRRTAHRRRPAPRAHPAGSPRRDRRKHRRGGLGIYELAGRLDRPRRTGNRSIRPSSLSHPGWLAADGGIRGRDSGGRRSAGNARSPRNDLGTGQHRVGPTPGDPLDRPRSGGTPNRLSGVRGSIERRRTLPRGMGQRDAPPEPGRRGSGGVDRLDHRRTDSAPARIRRANPDVLGRRGPDLGRLPSNRGRSRPSEIRLPGSSGRPTTGS